MRCWPFISFGTFYPLDVQRGQSHSSASAPKTLLDRYTCNVCSGTVPVCNAQRTTVGASAPLLDFLSFGPCQILQFECAISREFFHQLCSFFRIPKVCCQAWLGMQCARSYVLELYPQTIPTPSALRPLDIELELFHTLPGKVIRPMNSRLSNVHGPQMMCRIARKLILRCRGDAIQGSTAVSVQWS